MWPIRRVSQGIPIAIEAACLTSKEVLVMGLAGQGLKWRQRGFPGTGCYSLSQRGVA
jgi:hypothetical protein